MTDIVQPSFKDDYYVANFHTLAGFVVDAYKDLLKPQEYHWYARVSAASKPAQRLYIRLLTRKRSVFRLSRLSYREIKDIEAAASELAGSNLANSQPPVDLDELLVCFTKPELLTILELGQWRSLSRVELTQQISASEPCQQAQYRDRLQTADQWISIEGYRFWMLMQLCFFGNLYQDSSEFVMRELGTMRYENYPLECSTRAFESRQQIEAHWSYFECQALFDCTNHRSADDLMQLASTLPCIDNKDVNLARRVDRLRNRIARQLERLRRYDSAESLYERAAHPPARERRARLMMNRQQWQSALHLISQILKEPYNESERLVAQRLQSKCQKALGITQTKQPLFKPASSKLVLREQGVRVEELARRYYGAKGDCFHTENTLVNGVLGLFIWDILFYPLQGVFFNPFQIAPADFYQPEFFHRREQMLSERFAELSDPIAFGARIQSAFKKHQGKLNPLVRWQGLPPELLTLAIDRIPSAHWLAVFQRILQDPRENMAGFPDLVLFPEQGGYEFIEIKGPGDALQANQRRWMQYFDMHGITCRLVHLRYREP